jgi:CRISPR-associated protein Csm5
LVGDGQKLSPIDYMVWKDQVNVLDQRRIFRLLSKGPRLDGYLTQLKRADKLDFASWGGFAQNFADRRVPFEHPSCAAHWERARVESLQIPTFSSGPQGPYLPGSAVRGALRTGMLFAGLKEDSMAKLLGLCQGDRPPKRPAELPEDGILGAGGASRMRAIQAFDSDPLSTSCLRIYLLRVASLAARGRGETFELGWKQSPKGTAAGSKPAEGAPVFAEMASPGTVFEGLWRENQFLKQPEVLRALNWRAPVTRSAVFEAANEYAAALIQIHKRYAAGTGLSLVVRSLERLENRLSEARQNGDACLLCMGWGGGLLARSAWLKTDDPSYREIIGLYKLYGQAAYPGFPFPKTRRIVFLEDHPAALPGWALLEVAAS